MAAGRPPTRFFAVKTSGGQEMTVANFIQTRVTQKNKPVYSITVLDTQKGYIYVESDNAQVVSESTTGFRHIRGLVPGMIKLSDIERFLITKPVITELEVNDVVEIVAGPFKGMRARVNRVETAKSEVTLVLFDVPYQLPVTVDGKYVKLIQKVKG